MVALVTFGSMFSSLTEFPVVLAVPPYSLAVGIIGVAYLPQVREGGGDQGTGVDVRVTRVSLGII